MFTLALSITGGGRWTATAIPPRPASAPVSASSYRLSNALTWQSSFGIYYQQTSPCCWPRSPATAI